MDDGRGEEREGRGLARVAIGERGTHLQEERRDHYIQLSYATPVYQ
jgi:hypothetical protein